MEPRWAEWAQHAFAPIGLNIDNWSEDFYQTGQKISVPVTLLNDTYQDSEVMVEMVTADANGKILTKATPVQLTLSALANNNLVVDLSMPKQTPFVIYAYLSGDGIESSVISRRKVGFAHPGIEVQLPVLSPSIIRNK